MASYDILVGFARITLVQFSEQQTPFLSKYVLERQQNNILLIIVIIPGTYFVGRGRPLLS